MNADTSEGELLKAVKAEMQMLREQQAGVRFEIPPDMAFAVIGMLQLALRHPGTHGFPGDLARDFIELARIKFAPFPAISEVLRRGDHTAYDAPVCKNQVLN